VVKAQTVQCAELESATTKSSEMIEYLSRKWLRLACPIALSGCVVGADFDKGVSLAELPLGQASKFERQVSLAEGSADLVIAVGDGICRPVDQGTTVDITMTGMGMSIERSMKMGELAWAYAKESCDAYGYLYDPSAGLSKKFDVRPGRYQLVTRVRPAGSEESRVGTLWIIYGGRAPTTRMFPALRRDELAMLARRHLRVRPFL
jgi:hypothetical protein